MMAWEFFGEKAQKHLDLGPVMFDMDNLEKEKKRISKGPEKSIQLLKDSLIQTFFSRFRFCVGVECSSLYDYVDWMRSH